MQKRKSYNKWTEDEGNYILEYIEQNSGKPLQNLFNELSTDLNRSQKSVESYYYQNLKKNNKDLNRKNIVRGFWTQEKDNILIDIVNKYSSDFPTMVSLFKFIAKSEEGKKHFGGRSSTTLTQRWYSIKKQNKVVLGRQQNLNGLFNLDSDALDIFNELPSYIHELSNRVDKLEQKKYQPEISLGDIANALFKQQSVDSVSEKFEDEINSVKKENSELLAKIAQLEKKVINKQNIINKLQDKFAEAEEVFDSFINMASISQVMALGDFKMQMKTIIDKWGNVVSVELERKTS